MAERTLNEALSGAEIKEIILQEIGKHLDGDTTLENDLAYAGFNAKFTISIQYIRSLTKPTEVWGNAASPLPGASFEVAEPVETKREEITGEHTSADSPDIERQSHDLPIPVMVQTPSGMERKKVHIGRGRPVRERG